MAHIKCLLVGQGGGGGQSTSSTYAGGGGSGGEVNYQSSIDIIENDYAVQVGRGDNGRNGISWLGNQA